MTVKGTMGMLGIFSPLKDLVKSKSTSIDNNVFRLHHKATFLVLIICSVIVTSTQFIRDPIECIVVEIPNSVMNTFCWIHSTFTVKNKSQGITGDHFVRPGVAPSSDDCRDDDCRHHKYYQWVCFVLFFQAILFYVPRYLWKCWEGGKLNMLVQGLDHPIVDKADKKEKIRLLVDFFTVNKDRNDFYAIKFFLCEVLNLFNVVGQIHLMDWFLGGEFTSYGSDVLRMTQQPYEFREDPMDKIFPKVAKCTFHKFGPSGMVERFDGICVLPLNIINEKVYIFLWFWFIIVAAITAVQLVYRLVSMMIPALREFLLRARARLCPNSDIEEICRDSRLGDWFLLYQLAKNIDPLHFRDFMASLKLALVAERRNGYIN